MLVITRVVGESLRIGEDVTVKILGVDRRFGGAEVVLGFDAPRTIAIVRAELPKRDRARAATKRDPAPEVP